MEVADTATAPTIVFTDRAATLMLKVPVVSVHVITITEVGSAIVAGEMPPRYILRLQKRGISEVALSLLHA
jgi:hypothetical protein